MRRYRSNRTVGPFLPEWPDLEHALRLLRADDVVHGGAEGEAHGGPADSERVGGVGEA